tara:strand:+ start:768 stop:2027 length:1260 start_codon:yes stop_codon:yes gene_type:complete
MLFSSCSVLDYFEEEEIKLTGKRERVFKNEEKRLVKSFSKVVLPEPKLVNDWPQSNQNISNHYYHFLSQNNLKKQWKIKIGKGKGKLGPFISKPIVYNNIIFTIDNKFKIEARNSEQGDLAWTKVLKEEKKEKIYFTGGLAASNNVLFITTGIGNIYALNYLNGNLIWKKNILTQISAPPLINKQKVFVTTDDNQLIVFDANNGDEIWDHSGNIENVSIIGGVNPAIKNGIVYVTYSTGEIYALSENNGSIQWYENLGDSVLFGEGLITDIQSPPVIFEDKLYVSSFSGQFVVFNLIDGQRNWELNLSTINPIVISGDYIFLTDTDNKLYCIEKKEGKIIWVVQLKKSSKKKVLSWVGPILSSYKLILASSEGKIISLSPYNGNVISISDEKESITIPPIHAGTYIFFLTEDGELIAYK